MPSTTPGSKYSGWRYDNANSRFGAWALGTEFIRSTASAVTHLLASTFSGAVTFSSTALFSGLATFSASLKSTSPTVPIGYGAGAGAAKVTQITNRATGVAVTTVTGQIQTDTTSLAAEASAVFVVTATGLITATDVVVVSQVSGSNGGNTDLTVYAVAADQFSIRVSNNNASGGTAETGAIVMNYAIIKGSIT